MSDRSKASEIRGYQIARQLLADAFARGEDADIAIEAAYDDVKAFVRGLSAGFVDEGKKQYGMANEA